MKKEFKRQMMTKKSEKKKIKIEKKGKINYMKNLKDSKKKN